MKKLLILILLLLPSIHGAKIGDAGVVTIRWENVELLSSHDGLFDRKDELYLAVQYRDSDGYLHHEQTKIQKVKVGGNVTLDVQITLDYFGKFGSDITLSLLDADWTGDDILLVQSFEANALLDLSRSIEGDGVRISYSASVN